MRMLFNGLTHRFLSMSLPESKHDLLARYAVSLSLSLAKCMETFWTGNAIYDTVGTWHRSTPSERSDGTSDGCMSSRPSAGGVGRRRRRRYTMRSHWDVYVCARVRLVHYDVCEQKVVPAE